MMISRDVTAERAVLSLAHDLAAALAVGDRRRALGSAVALSDVTAELADALEATVPATVDLEELAGIARIRCMLP